MRAWCWVSCCSRGHCREERGLGRFGRRGCVQLATPDSAESTGWRDCLRLRATFQRLFGGNKVFVGLSRPEATPHLVYDSGGTGLPSQLLPVPTPGGRRGRSRYPSAIASIAALFSSSTSRLCSFATDNRAVASALFEYRWGRRRSCFRFVPAPDRTRRRSL